MDDLETGFHSLALEDQELAAVVEALHTWIVKRVGWCLWNLAWRELDWETNQTLLHAATQAYTKAFLALRGDGGNRDATAVFRLTPSVWDFLALVTSAESWGDVARHHHCRCERCLNPEKKMKHLNGCQCRLCTDVRLLEQPWLL